MTDQAADAAPIRPLGVGALLDAAIKLVRRHFVALAIVALVVSVPIELLRGLITIGTTDFCTGLACEDEFGGTTAYTYTNDVAYFAGQGGIILLSILLYVVVQIACFRIVAEGYLGRETGAGASMRYALARGWSTLWLSFLLLVSIGVGFLLLIVPGVWLTVSFTVAIPVLLVERMRGRRALRRSFELVQGYWWPTLGKVLVAYLLISVGAAAIGFVLALPILLFVDEASYGGLILTGIINLVATVATTPFLAAVTMLIYFDLRIRKEGFDLALLAEQMGGEAATATTTTSRPGGGTDDAFGNPVAPRTEAPTSSVPPPPREPVDWGPPRHAERASADAETESAPGAEQRSSFGPPPRGREEQPLEPESDGEGPGPERRDELEPPERRDESERRDEPGLPERRDEPEPLDRRDEPGLPDLGGWAPPRPGP